MVKKKGGASKANAKARQSQDDRPAQKNRRQSGQPAKLSKPKGAKSAQPKREGVRLNKFIANSGVCSRREADTYIATGLVTVNNKVVNTMGYQVKPGDEVRFDGRRLQQDPPAYVLLNKPKAVASTTSESKGLTVMDLIANATKARVAPVGRLGRNATGLFLFTNDDRLMQKLHKKGLPRLFHVELNKNFKTEDLMKIKEGVSIDGNLIAVEEISHVIRNLFDHLGYQVVKIDCVALAHLTKKDLPRGRFRHLTDDEISLFSML